MPVIVRNFFVALYVDGKQECVQTGPKAKEGGFSLRLYVRDDGQVKEVGTIEGLAWPDGRLKITYHPDSACNPVVAGRNVDCPIILAETHR